VSRWSWDLGWLMLGVSDVEWPSLGETSWSLTPGCRFREGCSLRHGYHRTGRAIDHPGKTLNRASHARAVSAPRLPDNYYYHANGARRLSSAACPRPQTERPPCGGRSTRRCWDRVGVVLGVSHSGSKGGSPRCTRWVDASRLAFLVSGRPCSLRHLHHSRDLHGCHPEEPRISGRGFQGPRTPKPRAPQEGPSGPGEGGGWLALVLGVSREGVALLFRSHMPRRTWVWVGGGGALHQQLHFNRSPPVCHPRKPRNRIRGSPVCGWLC
jgi:hypothetical protein